MAIMDHPLTVSVIFMILTALSLWGVTWLWRVLQGDADVDGGAVEHPHFWLVGSSASAGIGGAGAQHSPSLLAQQQHHQQSQQHQQQGLADPRPYACVFCGRRFKRSDHRRQHERLHTGEKPYGCPKCGAKFAQQSGLHYHRLNACREEQHNRVPV